MKFKVLISYENPFSEEIVEIEAQNIKLAKGLCEEIKNKNKEHIDYLESKNIYISKTIRECKIYKRDWRDDAIGFEDFLKEKQEE